MTSLKTRPECDLCGEPIDIRVLQPCNHNNICLHCFIRFNKNYKGNHCYFCQEPIVKGSEPVATTDMNINYEESRKRNPPFNSNFNIYVLNQEIVQKALDKLYQFECPDCGIVLPTIDTFTSHMRTHKKNVCNICFSSGRFMPESVPIFTHSKYTEHLKQHPKCICCHKTLFDQTTLANHMHDEHYRCELCAKFNKILWFKDAASLRRHNAEKHFACEHPECVTENIAFLTRGELLMHLQKVHGERERQIDFSTDFDNGLDTREVDDSRERMYQLNKKLMNRLNESFKNNPRAIIDLKGVARELITGSISCNEFYKQFSRICGDKKDLIFCDMVASMPDPRRRAELFRIHNGMDSLIHPSMQKSKSNPEMKKEKKRENISVEKRVAQNPPRVETQAQEDNHGGNRRRDKKRKRVVLAAF